MNTDYKQGKLNPIDDAQLRSHALLRQLVCSLLLSTSHFRGFLCSRPVATKMAATAAQEGAVCRGKAEWTPSRDAFLVDLFIEQHNSGRTSYNEFKNEVIRSVTRDFNDKFGLNLEENQIKNRYNVMKKDYGVFKTLLGHNGFGWDGTRRMVVADDRVWDNYIAVRSEARPFRRKTFPLYKQMSIIFECERATGKCVPMVTEEGNSNTKTARSSEPTDAPAQVVEGTLDSDLIIRISDKQLKKRRSVPPRADKKRV
ncbi:L10-interacting MYB domain-containing protein-like [Hibiscus syriacus]|uniref:L10-interacting MYB domain-containing protein-like n=1 Tax=Hibiscus syriacus TaxID=106335 RepID=UPI0019218DFA|nr:L10-interacting MYB domain-containing protein-like [Hibiscus syriacus]